MITILGAGLSGLIAANMLSHNNRVEVSEKQNSLPNNHSAVLRFRTSAIGDVLNIPFKKVQMIKSVMHWRNPVADALAYSRKNGGIMRSDRSIGDQRTIVADRFIAPPDLIYRMSTKLKINYNKSLEIENEPIISTIPMPSLMSLLGYKSIPPFSYVAGKIVIGEINNCDAYVSIVVPDPGMPFSRISITGNQLMIECTNKEGAIDDIMNLATYLLGIDEDDISGIQEKEQKYFKINPINDDERKKFMFWATDSFGIYSLGRYATWRPKLLLDDLINDIRLIENWINKSDRYGVARHRVRA